MDNLNLAWNIRGSNCICNKFLPTNPDFAETLDIAAITPKFEVKIFYLDDLSNDVKGQNLLNA